MKKGILLLGVLLGGLLSVNSTSADIGSANFLADKKIIVDQSQTPELYEIEKNIERQAVMKIVMKLSEREVPDTCRGEFGDVNRDDWPCKYIEAALDAEFIARNENFRPKDLLTKTEAMKLVLKSRGIEKVQTTDNWQEDYMKTALYHNIIFEEYTDYDTFATRGWLFSIASLSVINEGTAGLTDDSVYMPEPVIESTVKQDVSIYRENYDNKTVTVGKGQRDVVLGDFSARLVNYLSDEELRDGFPPYPNFSVHRIVMRSLHDDIGEVVDKISLYDRRNNSLISEISGDAIGNGASMVFDFDYPVRGGNYDDPIFEFRADISADATPNAVVEIVLAYSDTGLDPDVFEIRDESNRQLTEINGYHEVRTNAVTIQNDGLRIEYLANDLRYIHRSAKDIEIGNIQIHREFGRDHDGKFDYGSITLSKNESTPGSRVQDIRLIPHEGYISQAGGEISGKWNGDSVTFDLSSTHAEYFSIRVDMTDSGSEEGIRDEINFGIQDFTAYDSDGEPMTIVIDSSKYVETDIIYTQVLTQLGQKLPDSEYDAVSISITQATEPLSPSVPPKVPDYGYQQKISSFTVTAEDGNVFIKNMKLKQLPHARSSEVGYISITDGEYEPVWSGEISEDGTVVDVGIEVFEGVTKIFNIQVFQAEVIEPGLGDSFDIMDIEAITELGEPRLDLIPRKNIEGLDIQ